MNGAALVGAALVTMALVLVPRTGAAQSKAGAPGTDSEAVSLLYEDSPPADCPNEAEFEAEVTKLTSKARFTKERRARRVRIELASSGHDVVGRLISGDGKNQASREVRGKDCREVSSALAIAVALTIDPAALLGDSEPAHPAEAPESPSGAPKRPAPPLAPRPATPPPATPPTLTPPAKTNLRWGLGAGLMLESAWAPQMLPGGHVFALVGAGDHFRARLGATRFITQRVDNASFGAWLAEGAVSWNVALLGALRPFAGVGIELGAVDAAGTGLPTATQAQRPWRAASVELGLRVETASFFFQLGGSLLVPISRQRYLVSDQLGQVRTLYEVPGFGLKQETSLGVFL